MFKLWSIQYNPPLTAFKPNNCRPLWLTSQNLNSSTSFITRQCLFAIYIAIPYFTCTTLAELFSEVPSRTIVNFIKKIGLHHKV